MDIPITFEHRGKTHSGHFGQVQGSGNTAVYHLMSDDNYYLGRLQIGFEDDWYFDESDPKDELKYLARFFGNYVTQRV